jgi:DNA-binding transcriptional ArsR family regulator
MNNYSLTLNGSSDNGTLLKVDLLSIKKAALVLRAVNHKLRQQILKLIDEHKKMTVTELYVKLRLEQSVASQHLAILRKAGFVKTTRDGKFIYYSVNINRMEELNKFIEEILG